MLKKRFTKWKKERKTKANIAFRLNNVFIVVYRTDDSLTYQVSSLR